jgi:ribonucleoside-triphosphate reductase
MPHIQWQTSLKIFDAIAAQLRLQILRGIYTQGSLSYVEIMNHVNLDPSRDAGKFAYHLRILRRAELLEADNTTKKYRLTPLGIVVINFSQDIEEQVMRERRHLQVRTSRLAIEEFDRLKIVQALHREGGVPVELAQKIAEETEERLHKLDALYLTAPLIREFVNVVLIEKGLHEYRHKLTRLGLPVHDVAQLIKEAKPVTEREDANKLMGKNVMTEYVLLDVLPREVADAHLSGRIHLQNVDAWVLKPDRLQHDLRVFLRNGFQPSITAPIGSIVKSPKDFEDALAIAFLTLSSSSSEVASEQGINHFNLFLAPYARNRSAEALKAALRRFLFTLNQSISARASIDVSIGLDFSIPPSFEDVQAVEPRGSASGAYYEYLDETMEILIILLDVIEEAAEKPLFHPRFIFNIAPCDLKNKDVEVALLKAHKLATTYGTPSFANLSPNWQRDTAYFASGIRLASSWTGDVELDTMRAGILGTTVINLPRVIYRAKKSEKRLFDELNACLAIAVKAHTIRYNRINERIEKSLLPFLSQRVAGDPYLRIKNTAFLVDFVGLNEAVKAMTGQDTHEDKHATEFAVKIVNHLTSRAKEIAEKNSFRVVVSQSDHQNSSHRLAKLDVETFGWGVVVARGARSAPYYTDRVTIPLEAKITLQERLAIESRFHPLLLGGHLSLIEIEETTPEALLRLSRKICQTSTIGAYAFSRSLSYCFNCQRSFTKHVSKCPKCESERALYQHNRFSNKYLPLKWGPVGKRRAQGERVRYRVV